VLFPREVVEGLLACADAFQTPRARPRMPAEAATKGFQRCRSEWERQTVAKSYHFFAGGAQRAGVVVAQRTLCAVSTGSQCQLLQTRDGDRRRTFPQAIRRWPPLCAKNRESLIPLARRDREAEIVRASADALLAIINDIRGPHRNSPWASSGAGTFSQVIGYRPPPLTVPTFCKLVVQAEVGQSRVGALLRRKSAIPEQR
jgi:hypothetical protein